MWYAQYPYFIYSHHLEHLAAQVFNIEVVNPEIFKISRTDQSIIEVEQLH